MNSRDHNGWQIFHQRNMQTKKEYVHHYSTPFGIISEPEVYIKEGWYLVRSIYYFVNDGWSRVQDNQPPIRGPKRSYYKAFSDDMGFPNAMRANVDAVLDADEISMESYYKRVY